LECGTYATRPDCLIEPKNWLQIIIAFGVSSRTCTGAKQHQESVKTVPGARGGPEKFGQSSFRPS
jgi:hypothetical protein